MEGIYNFYIIVIVVAIGRNYILNKKMQKQIDALIDANEILLEKTIKQIKTETEMKEILNLAEQTHEFAVHTVQKIKKIIYSK